MDDAGAFVFADLRPRHDPVFVAVIGIVAGASREGRPNRGQLIERTGVAPADELSAGDLIEDLERACQSPPNCLLPQPELVIALADADVSKRRPDGRSD